ncbi:MAG: hypothetical protein ACOC22_02430 [bacterium]
MATTIKFKRGTSRAVNNYTDAQIAEPVFDYESGRLFISKGDGSPLIPVDQSVHLQGFEGFEQISYGSISGTSVSSGGPSTDTDDPPGTMHIDSDSGTPSLLVSNPSDGDAVWATINVSKETSGAPTASDTSFTPGAVWVDTDNDEAFVYLGEDGSGDAVWVSFATAGAGANVHTDTSDPTENDDSYSVGTIWINTDSDEYFVCVDNSSESAIWVTGAGSGVSVHTDNSDPTADDDSYSVGTIWINTDNDTYFVCTDNTSGDANWVSSSSSPQGVETSTSDPTEDDDSFDVGTIWINTDTDTFFICTDNSSGAAVWDEGGSEGTSIPDQSGHDGEVLKTDGSDLYWDSISSSGSPYIDKRIDEIYLDDNNTGCDYGAAFELFPCVDFEDSKNGSIWFSFEIPNHFDSSSDINIRLVYNLDGDDSDSDIKLKSEYWAVTDGGVPSSSSPNETSEDTINSDSTQSVKRKVELTNGYIRSEDISDNDSITYKLTRLASDDDYSGIFQLIAIEIYQ